MIPTYEEIMLPFLEHISDGNEHSSNDIHDALAERVGLTDAEIRELLPSGTQPTFRNRVGWAKTYLKKAGLVSTKKRGNYLITKRGHELLIEKPKEITSKFLTRFEDFVEFITLKKNQQKDSNDTISTQHQTPEEALEYAFLKLKNDLIKEVVDLVKNCSPAFFEKLVIDILVSMGYGGSRKDAGQAVGKSGDGGIDGIIKEDKLGLDIIYLQAKRWENSIPVKEVRDFTGALASKKAKKGIFITTSNFPKSVYEFVNQVEYKIILIDGEKLAELMIEHNVGISTINSYQVKKIDFDYFDES